MTAWIIVSSLAALIVGFGVGTLLQLKRAHSRLNLSRNEARRITDEAEKQAELTRRTAELEAKEIAERGRRELEQEIK